MLVASEALQVILLGPSFHYYFRGKQVSLINHNKVWVATIFLVADFKICESRNVGQTVFVLFVLSLIG